MAHHDLTAPLTPEQLTGAPLPLPATIAAALPCSGMYPLLSLDTPTARHHAFVSLDGPACHGGKDASASGLGSGGGDTGGGSVGGGGGGGFRDGDTGCGGGGACDHKSASASITDGFAVAVAWLGVRPGDRLLFSVAENSTDRLVLCIQRILPLPAGLHAPPQAAAAEPSSAAEPVSTPAVAAAPPPQPPPASTP